MNLEWFLKHMLYNTLNKCTSCKKMCYFYTNFRKHSDLHGHLQF